MGTIISVTFSLMDRVLNAVLGKRYVVSVKKVKAFWQLLDKPIGYKENWLNDPLVRLLRAEEAITDLKLTIIDLQKKQSELEKRLRDTSNRPPPPPPQPMPRFVVGIPPPPPPPPPPMHSSSIKFPANRQLIAKTPTTAQLIKSDSVRQRPTSNELKNCKRQLKSTTKRSPGGTPMWGEHHGPREEVSSPEDTIGSLLTNAFKRKIKVCLEHRYPCPLICPVGNINPILEQHFRVSISPPPSPIPGSPNEDNCFSFRESDLSQDLSQDFSFTSSH